MGMTYDDALLLAVRAHDGQTRELPNGKTEPYVCHPIRVAAFFTDDENRQVAVLHDVLEDTAVTRQDLRRFGFSTEVIRSVWILTRIDDVSYAEFIHDIMDSEDRVAIAVKRADLIDNLATMHGSYERLRKSREAALRRLSEVLPQ